MSAPSPDAPRASGAAISATAPRGFHRDSRGHAYLGGTRLTDVLADDRVATPCYVYDLGGIRDTVRQLVTTLRSNDVVAYAVKANSAGSIVRSIATEGGGADVVSGGELELAIACGIDPAKIVMSGVAKTDAEIDDAITLELLAIQAESVEELHRIDARARALGRKARVGLRLNPSVEIDSHSHIATGHDAAKFGIRKTELDEAWHVIDSSTSLQAMGVSAHVGSQLGSTSPYVASARSVCDLARARADAGKRLSYVDFGGGFGIDYGTGAVAEPASFAAAALELLRELRLDDHRLVVEPGRSIVGPFGVLVASVIQTKTSENHRWVMLDAGMNDLIRPALYGARHRVEPIDAPPGPPGHRVVGPVCESSDDFGHHELGDTPLTGVVIRDAGAYGFTLASEYNGRPLPAEVFLEDGRIEHVSPAPGRAAWLRRRLDA